MGEKFQIQNWQIQDYQEEKEQFPCPNKQPSTNNLMRLVLEAGLFFIRHIS